MLIALWLFISAAHAADPMTLTWDNSVQLTLRNNADLSSARSAYESTHELEGVARNGFFPQIAGTLSYAKADKHAIEKDGIYTGMLTATQNIFSGLSDLAKYKQAMANTRAAAATFQIAKAKVSHDLKAAFEGLAYASEYIRLTNEIIQRRLENLRLVQMRFQGGRENEGSVLLSKAYLAQAKLDDLQAHDSQRTAQVQMAAILGLDRYDAVEIRGEVPVQEPARPASFNEIAVHTPDYLQALAQEDAGRSALTIAEAPFLPSLSVTGSTGQVGGNFFPHEQDKWRVEADLTFPLFNGGRDYFSSRSASASYMAAEKSRISVSRQLLSKLEQAYATYSEAVMALTVATSFREAASLRAEIARKKYNNGLLSFDEWDLIENDLITRQKNYLQAKRDRVLAEAAWEQALGKGVIP